MQPPADLPSRASRRRSLDLSATADYRDEITAASGSGRVLLESTPAQGPTAWWALPEPPPPDWSPQLRDWPPPVRGLQRIELEAGRAWVLVADRLSRRSRQRLMRELADWRDAPGIAGAAAPREAIVVGAGLAGCAVTDALARRGWRVTVLEQAERPGGVVADIPLLAQHPALSPGDDRRSRLLVAALLASGRLGARIGTALAIGGRFQAMPLAEARGRAAGLPAAVVQVVERSSAAAHGIDGHSGLWFPGCATIDPARWWRRVATQPEVSLRLATGVAAIRRDGGRWLALDACNAEIAGAPVLVLANQAHAFELAGLDARASGPLRRRPLQVLVGQPSARPPQPSAAADEDAAPRAAPVLGIDGYRLEWPGRACVLGPVPAGAADTAASTTRALLAAWSRRLPGASDHWSWRLSPPAERLLLRDTLPMAGAVPDMAAIEAARERHQRNDRLALPRREGLYLLTGMGGRGLLWSVLGAEVVAALAAREPPVVEPELADAIDPARFVRRSLRRAQ